MIERVIRLLEATASEGYGAGLLATNDTGNGHGDGWAGHHLFGNGRSPGPNTVDELAFMWPWRYWV